MTIAMDLQAAAQATDGTLVGNNRRFQGLSTDSRTVAGGQLFVALRGDSFDGHAYLANAVAQGAVAAVVAEDAVATLPPQPIPLLQVADTRLALGALAADWRRRFSLPLLAVTGSNGKSSTKEMVASILRAAFGDAVLSTPGNFNNDIGLPLTLFQLADEHRAAVVEMGMNRPGEIAYLAAIAKPVTALVTNAQRAHLAGLGSMEAIASEKGSIFSGLAKDGVAVFNADDRWADLWRRQSGACRSMSFGFERPADVRGESFIHGLESRLRVISSAGDIEIELALPGRHNACNALAAATACLASGISLACVGAGLSAFRGMPGRLQRRPARQGAILLDDTYNANPDSVRAGIDVLAATVGRKVLVLGDMGEIGEMSAQFHDEIGGYAKSQGIDRLFAFGTHSALAAHNFGAGGEHFEQIDALLTALTAELTSQTTVLVKGSRFMRMERIADAIASTPAGGEV